MNTPPLVGALPVPKIVPTWPKTRLIASAWGWIYLWVTVIEECPAIRASTKTSPPAAAPSLVKAVHILILQNGSLRGGDDHTRKFAGWIESAVVNRPFHALSGKVDFERNRDVTPAS